MRKRAPILSRSATLFGTFSLSLSSLLIADDVTPRPCHVAWGQDGRPGSGGYFLPYFTPIYLFLFFRSVFLLPEKYKFSLSLSLSLPSLSLSLSFSREALSNLARSSWIWHVLKRRILHGGLILHSSISPFISCAPPFVPSRSYDSFRVFSYLLVSFSCHYLFCFFFLRVSFFFFSWFAYLLSSSSSLFSSFPIASFFISLFFHNENHRVQMFLVLQPLDVISRSWPRKMALRDSS